MSETMPLINPKPKSMDCDFDAAKHSEELRQDWAPQATYVADSTAAVRLAFIRKVYLVLCLQLFVTSGAVVAAVGIPSYRAFLLHNRWLSILTMVLSFALLLPLCVLKDRHPINLYLLAGWTLDLSLLVSFGTMFVPPAILCHAFVLTFAITLGLTLYTFKSKRDFDFLGGGLSAGLMLLICMGLIRIFFPMGPVVHLLYAGFGALLFCGFLLYDTSRLLHRHTVDDWIPAVIDLYLDILNLFLNILQLLDRCD